jgi:hypothetical protein
MGMGGAFGGVKQLRHDADHSLPPNVEVKNSGVLPSLPHVFMLLIYLLAELSPF